ncbi:MAG TPA: LamG-like jellyroll fold domain-containing protein, partial [Phnomibacter sp.]|nr:LamG-like jellyroll fold domain-containing protein [Phnomibacter sp.]
MSADPLFVNPAMGDLALQSWSCAIDAGNNSAIPAEVTTDLAGNDRMFNNGIVDMGAFEYQGARDELKIPSISFNNGLQFDGVKDHVAVSNLTNCIKEPFGLSPDAITIEYWFKGSNLRSAVRFQNGGNYIVAGWGSPGALKHILSNDGGVDAGLSVGTAATDGNWHHVAFTWQRNATNGFRSYLDGALVEQRNSSDNALPDIQSLWLGSHGGYEEFMNGTLENVRVWKVARTQAEIQAGMNCSISLPNNDLLIYYKFDHGLANGSNGSSTLLLNSANPGTFTGILNGFALEGISSNWVEGLPDAALTTWYADTDGDGFGDLNVSVQACQQPEGYVANHDDCNDSNPNVNPAATEICNGIDDNCSGVVDDGNVCCPEENILFVNANATGDNNGTSWANAFIQLQDALALATGCSNITEIWVAAGTYYPDEGGGKNNNDRTASFTLKNGVAIYGGFVGTETLRTQRNWQTNATILSGDLMQNDEANFAGNWDNAYHVVKAEGTNSSAVLDGFIITAGHSNGSFPQDRGGGMYNQNASPTIANCIFLNNSGGSSGTGGGMANYSG